MAEKGGLLGPEAAPAPGRTQLISSRRRIGTACLLLPTSLVLLWLHLCVWGVPRLPGTDLVTGGGRPIINQCPQVEPLLPEQSSKELLDMDGYLKSSRFRNESIERLSDAVRIPTESFDDMGPIGCDKRWDIFYEFAQFLEKTFPLTHKTLDLERVNAHGLVYTWLGGNPSMKPTLLMAHQDVVPVPKATIDSWTHPPFDGVYDGKYVWGRGASDCKNSLIAILESVELLLAAGYRPQRTVILSFGFDEEVSGPQGAGHLAPFLLDRYGKDSFAVIVDEGAPVTSIWGSHFAQPGVAEKGYVDVDIVVRMPGGHSSIPPQHNGIGVMSELITMIEDHPYEPYLDAENPYLGLLQCGAAYSPDFPSSLRKLLPKGPKQCKAKQDRLAHEAAKAGLSARFLMQTSVAVDVIGGGSKVNALPERTSALVNHRVNVGEHPATVKAKLTKLARAVADKYNLTLHGFGCEKETPSSLPLTAAPSELEPAPVTPTSTLPISPYSVLSGTTRALYGTQILMAPGIMTGNTDTRYYWDLSRHIFRYAMGWDPEDKQGGLGQIHTVDEKISVTAHVSAAQWYSLFIRNMDEAPLL